MAYAGRVVLVDIWATWCAPRIQALPKLRELHGELSPARFALLSISVDDELEAVTDFMRDEPMPWSNRHVGLARDVAQAWNAKAFPTYILVDPLAAKYETLQANIRSLGRVLVAFSGGVDSSLVAYVAAAPGRERACHHLRFPKPQA